MSQPTAEPPSPLVLERIVRMALEEDVARGDLTTEACVPADVRGHALLNARESLVFCGLPVVEAVYRLLGGAVEVVARAADGERLEPGATACELVGPARAILVGERVALNFAQRLSGVATQARRYVDALPEGSRTRIADTRKTTPGLRAFERWAVRCGGAHNHREDLSSAVLIKDNHIAAAGGVRAAIEAAQAYAPHTSRIECEVDTWEQMLEALDAGADILLLDNFDDALVAKTVAHVQGHAILEASGGITLARIPKLAETGVDVISSGALTHSAPAVDLGLDWGAEAR
ncbi:MAG TPA: carboxylating nicotinate-nucleotide diphosphorylase [Polyangiaceae bacterium LLY-WYZ-15_(1-7)]|nr:nicotinate-nucleotide diphosphorylase (carboxylating) [Sandaracinus sp.]HJL04004.1 carboxylating nicotinate-nucleotide diphosphorylase [Polyangiaceae bacterium LLY-WYZ-15_(1-7)]MBJ72833.1 nicotinate-nucleotide diphosphorylase (carboxylating) [Sandaracinus sp.]HJL10542.1 carboxylating nicotinate-nucleotide diphosphorylase [Polyangiaceae bacterium LLY-WYZ-15_(1-7)]HJL21900.1 carboxylating nicotinate-nucleotide diphosphorylase [Polyangiaceae bacterium LLY-WYZ-15_(1-7)]